MENEPNLLSSAEGRPATPTALLWAGTLAVVLALLQVPWVCAGLAVTPLPSEVTHFEFMLLRARAVAPAIGATVLACAVLLDRRRGAHRTLATTALVIALAVLYLVNFAIKWHAGD